MKNCLCVHVYMHVKCHTEILEMNSTMCDTENILSLITVYALLNKILIKFKHYKNTIQNETQTEEKSENYEQNIIEP